MGSAAAGDENNRGLTMGTTKEVLLTPDEVCERLRVSPHVLRRMRGEGTGPKFYRLGHRTVRYCPASVEAWLRAQEVTK